jgi:hypothetical protein
VLEFYEPEITDVQMRVYVKRMTRANFDMDVIAAGIEQYANTYVYGKTRNWAHLILCCSEIRNASVNIMPAGIAAGIFFQRLSGQWVLARDTSPGVFMDSVIKSGYGEINASYIAAAQRMVGDGIRWEESGFAERRFMTAFKEVVERTELPSVPQLSSGAKSIKELLNSGDKHGGSHI